MNQRAKFEKYKTSIKKTRHNKRIILTAISENLVDEWFVSWYGSLRSLGRYDGLVGVLSYGLRKETEQKLIRNDIKIFKGCKKYKQIVNDRFVTIGRLASSALRNHIIIHWDSDVWFQQDINDVFVLSAHNISMTPDCLRCNVKKKVMIPVDHLEHQKAHNKMDWIKRKYGSYLQGGFVGGPSAQLGRRFNKFTKMLEEGIVPDKWWTDQFCFSYLMSSQDEIISRTWNGIWRDLDVNKKWIMIEGKICKAVHVVGNIRYLKAGRDKFLFKKRHPQLFRKYQNRLRF